MRKSRKYFSLLLAALLAASLTACGNSSADDSAADSQEGTSGTFEGEEEKITYDGFQVVGNDLYDANGNLFIMRGINHAHNWYNDKDVSALNAIAETGANCVRLVLSDGEEYNKDSEAVVSALIKGCANRGMVAVLEVHDGTGSNDIGMVEKATDYWIEIKDALIGYEDVAILNIINEWQGGYSKSNYEKAYTEAVKRIREAGIENTIMIDAGGWGQTAKSVAECGPSILEADVLGNTMFSIHMYGTAGKDADTIKTNIDNARNAGLCVCIGEFGYTHSDGDVDEAFLMQYCTEIGVGYIAWSWKGNGGGVEYLDMAERWDGGNLSPEWGEVVVYGEYGLKATSRKCTVFDEE